MQNNDLTRARRKLAKLKRRADILKIASQYAVFGANGIECRRMAREIAREIAAQDLECRRLALTGPWKAGPWMVPTLWVSYRDGECKRWFPGKASKRNAVAWAEKMNRKAGER